MQKAKAITSRPDRSAGHSTSRTAPKTFQFVDALPTTDAEKSQNKILVRSNASNFHWKRVKKSSNSTTGQTVPRKRQLNHAQPKSLRRALAPLQIEKKEDISCENGPSKTNEEEEHSWVDSESVVSSEAISESAISRGDPWTMIAVDRHDPFETYPSDLPKEFVNHILHQMGAFLSLMFPPEKGKSLSILSEKWLRMTFRDRVLFHASLFCQITRNKVLLEPEPETQEQIQCYAETIRGVHQKFEDASVSCADENILSVYALCCHGALRPPPPTVVPTQGPLANLLLLHVYGGRLEIVQLHVQGLAKMLSFRGGISKIELPGLAQAISYIDIIMACQNLSKPLFPYMAMHQDVSTKLTIASRKNHPLVGLGRGFRVLPEMLGQDEVSDLLVVLRWVIQYTFAIDDYIEGRAEAMASSRMADERNFVQHNLMLLTPVPGDAHVEEEEEEEHPIHRLCRLGTLVYSLLVIFPIPAVAAPFYTLADEIKAQLLQPSVQARWLESPELILWVTVMGAIAAIGSPQRDWYLTTLDRLTKRLTLTNWDAMREMLGMFLWFGVTNDSDGEELWREMEDSSPFRVPGSH